MVRQQGTIFDIFIERGITKAVVDVDGVSRTVFLTLLMDARVGDDVLIEKDLAFSTVPRSRKVIVEVE
jgi:hydrogenase maturation factor